MAEQEKEYVYTPQSIAGLIYASCEHEYAEEQLHEFTDNLVGRPEFAIRGHREFVYSGAKNLVHATSPAFQNGLELISFVIAKEHPLIEGWDDRQQRFLLDAALCLERARLNEGLDTHRRSKMYLGKPILDDEEAEGVKRRSEKLSEYLLMLGMEITMIGRREIK